MNDLVTQPEVLAFLRRQDLTATLNEIELLALVSAAELRRYAAGDVVLREGENAGALFLLLRGQLKVSKDVKYLPDPDNDLPDEQTLSWLNEGTLVGEVSFVDGEPASATVRACGPCDMLVVTRESLRDASGKAPTLENRVVAGVARILGRRLRNINTRHAEEAHSKRHLTNLRKQFTLFFVITLALFGIASTVQKLINAGLPPLWQMLYSWAFLLLTFTPIAWFVWRLRLPAAAWGLSLYKARRSVVESLAAGVGMGAVAVGWRLISKAPGAPMFAWTSLVHHTTVELGIFFFAYGPHCFLQELIGRGVIQGSLARFLPEFRPEVPVLLTSVLFGIFHLYVSASFAVVTFGVSVIFGLLYRRHGTLLGVTILHYLIGVLSMALGFN
jgi:CRP-like cAMP-binding protein